VWTCDAAKVGYFWAVLSEKTGDQVLLEKAKRAAAFLLRVQTAEGDLRGSVFAEDGTVVSASNLGGTVSPVLLWSKLHQITKEVKYVEAARKTADFVVRTWMSNDRWQTYGGEIDSFFHPDMSSMLDATMAFSALAMATGEERHREYARAAANCLIASQYLFDINWGYYRKEARWNGRDQRTAGSLQGAGGPQSTMSMYMAWKATDDALYRQALEAHTNWMTYMQYDNPDSAVTFGGGDESSQIPTDEMNGFGSNFWPETVGQGIAIMEYLNDLDGAVKNEQA
jgi:hypothetical protein